MGIRQELARVGRRLMVILAIALLSWTTWGCAKPTQPTTLLSEPALAPNRLTAELAEVSPPETLVVLKQIIDAYTPQVRILSPRPGEIVDSTSVAVRLQVRGLPLFKNPTWQLGPHLQLFLDDQPYQAIYDLSEPIRLENLSPGTHTLRVFASRPWHEGFKNQGAFDQRTFHIFAQTPQTEVNGNAPLLTYGQPQGTYGAEPIMLDFYLSNVPLHVNAQADKDKEILDWRIRCTINGQSFVFDQWQPVFLKGFKPGRNWLQLELIDDRGEPIDNRFNNVVRTIDYQPGGNDTLSRLVRGELDLEQVAGIIDPTYAMPESQPSGGLGPEEPVKTEDEPQATEVQEGAVDQPQVVESEQVDLEEDSPLSPLETNPSAQPLPSPAAEPVESPELAEDESLEVDLEANQELLPSLEETQPDDKSLRPEDDGEGSSVSRSESPNPEGDSKLSEDDIAGPDAALEEWPLPLTQDGISSQSLADEDDLEE